MPHSNALTVVAYFFGMSTSQIYSVEKIRIHGLDEKYSVIVEITEFPFTLER